MVMDGLKELDPVAYVRFASVYRNFREEKDFVQFVDKIDVFKKRLIIKFKKKIYEIGIRSSHSK